MGRRRRDATAADRLARELPTVWRYALAMVRDEARARALTREVFASLDPALLTVDDGGLTRLLLARTRRLLEDRDGGPDAPTDAVEPVDTEPVSATSGPPRVLALELQRLAAAEREAVVLRDVLGVGAADAATVCDTSVEEVRARRHRGHRDLVSALLGGDA